MTLWVDGRINAVSKLNIETIQNTLWLHEIQIFLLISLVVKDCNTYNCNEVHIIISISDEREDVQKKSFTKWINSQLSKVGI